MTVESPEKVQRLAILHHTRENPLSRWRIYGIWPDSQRNGHRQKDEQGDVIKSIDVVIK